MPFYPTSLTDALGYIRRLEKRLEVADKALAFIAEQPRGGVVVDGTPEGDRDIMIERARDARQKISRIT